MSKFLLNDRLMYTLICLLLLRLLYFDILNHRLLLCSNLDLLKDFDGLKENSRRKLENSNTNKNSLAPGLIFQTKEESNYLKLHKCRDSGEAYAAAYLMTKEHLLYQNTGFNLSMVNCEMGSFVMLYRGRREKENATVIMSLDVLDYSVIHLSAFERLQRRWQHVTGKPRGIAPILTSIEYVKQHTLKILQQRSDSSSSSSSSSSSRSSSSSHPSSGVVSNTSTSFNINGVDNVNHTNISLKSSSRSDNNEDKSSSNENINTKTIPPSPPPTTLSQPKFIKNTVYVGGRRTSQSQQTPSITGEGWSQISQSIIQNKMDRTVAIMPFLGFANGAGHSKTNNRFEYLKACVWSLRALFKHIVVYIKSAKDKAWIESSGLPVWKAELLTNLPKHAALPVASVLKTKSYLQSKIWDFDYIFFTESDQILINRGSVMNYLYHHLDKYPRRMALPHRSMPYPIETLIRFHQRLDLQIQKDLLQVGEYVFNFASNTGTTANSSDSSNSHGKSVARRLSNTSTSTTPKTITSKGKGMNKNKNNQNRKKPSPIDTYTHSKSSSTALSTLGTALDSLAAAGFLKGRDDVNANEWREYSCCLTRDACQGRKSWVHIAYTGAKVFDESNKLEPKAKHKPVPPADMQSPMQMHKMRMDSSGVVVQNIYGLNVPLGNTNFLRETYRKCKLTHYTEVCP